jgi:hypothetical protein
MNIEGVLDIIKSLDKTEIITLRINKIEGKENF